MLGILWGFKTVAAFDIWSFVHLIKGVSIGDWAKKITTKFLSKLGVEGKYAHKSVIGFEVIIVLFSAYLWETIEHYLETGLIGGWWTYWFQGVEFWANRFITDPLMLVVGYYFVKRYPKILVPARVLFIVWMILHLFVFPHSMWLHTLFG